MHNKQKNDAELEEQKRCNEAMEKKGSGLLTTVGLLVARYGLEKIVNALKKKTGKGIFFRETNASLNNDLLALIKEYPHPLSNFDIEKLGKKLNIKNFRGVLMIDELPAKPRKFETGIVNLDTSDHVGAHWICYFKKGNKKIVFDSYGGNVPKELVTYLKSNDLFFSAQRLQNYDEYICGHLCLLALKLFSEGYDYPSEILDTINDLRHFRKPTSS